MTNLIQKLRATIQAFRAAKAMLPVVVAAAVASFEAAERTRELRDIAETLGGEDLDAFALILLETERKPEECDAAFRARLIRDPCLRSGFRQ